MSNVVLFRRRAVLSEQVRAAGPGKTAYALLRLRSMPRPSLVATWHVNAAGRLECRWSCRGSASLDEAGSLFGSTDRAA